ncbi:MAG: dipeptidase [Clostridiales bacterium]|nr:dipeptidase [Clostridiales bacterium]
MKKKIFRLILVTTLFVALLSQSAFACTTYGIGKDATADGSTIVTHTCDSTGDDFRLWIIPPMEGGEGITRDIVMDGNTWGDWSQFPEVKNYGSGVVLGEMPQPTDTYQYLHTNYSICNENGVAMGESTCGFDRSTEQGEKIKELLFDTNDGIIDCYQAQHVALANATTAREAVEIMGDLVEEYGWNAYCENINICDGEEVWIAEFYGRDLWCAVRIPDDAFFVCANRARINEIDFEDTKHENFMWSENLVQYAIDNGLWDESSEEPFNPALTYAPNTSLGCKRREWRALDLVAPSLKLDPDADFYPLYVVPEKKLSVQDVFLMNGDYYQGTDYDVSLSPEAGPYGNPINEFNVERPINMYRATYHTIHNVKGWLPKEVRCLVWHGHGASDSTFIAPLWASMTELPDIYTTGSRYGKFDRGSAWWVASYVQQTATQNYRSAIKEIHEARDGKMANQYIVVDQIQATAAKLIEEGNPDAAIDLITSYAYNNALDWHNYWLEFGDELYGTYMFNRVDMKQAPYPDWWKEVLQSAPRNPGFEEEAE